MSVKGENFPRAQGVVRGKEVTLNLWFGFGFKALALRGTQPSSSKPPTQTNWREAGNALGFSFQLQACEAETLTALRHTAP